MPFSKKEFAQIKHENSLISGTYKSKKDNGFTSTIRPKTNRNEMV